MSPPFNYSITCNAANLHSIPVLFTLIAPAHLDAGFFGQSVTQTGFFGQSVTMRLGVGIRPRNLSI
jgi:hypothetical protein